MAQTVTLDGLRNQIITSIFGRRYGLAPGNQIDNSDYLVGPKDLRKATITITTASTAADQIPAYGTVLFNTTGASTAGTTYHSLQSPVPGVTVKVVNLSTLAMSVWMNGSTVTTAVLGYVRAILSTGLTTATQVNLPGVGASANFTGLTTAIWLVESHFGTSVTTWGSSAT